MALLADNPSDRKSWWHEMTGFFHDLFHSEEQAERLELLARAAAERARREQREPVAPQWLRLD